MNCSHRATQRRGAVIVERGSTQLLRTRCPMCHSVVDGLPDVQRDGTVIVRKWITSDFTGPEFDLKDP